LYFEFVLLKEELHLLVFRSYSSSWDTKTITKRNCASKDPQIEAIFLGEHTPDPIKNFLNCWKAVAHCI
jgi:hypothetical protein